MTENSTEALAEAPPVHRLTINADDPAQREAIEDVLSRLGGGLEKAVAEAAGGDASAEAPFASIESLIEQEARELEGARIPFKAIDGAWVQWTTDLNGFEAKEQALTRQHVASKKGGRKPYGESDISDAQRALIRRRAAFGTLATAWHMPSESGGSMDFTEENWCRLFDALHRFRIHFAECFANAARVREALADQGNA